MSIRQTAAQHIIQAGDARLGPVFIHALHESCQELAFHKEQRLLASARELFPFGTGWYPQLGLLPLLETLIVGKQPAQRMSYHVLPTAIAEGAVLIQEIFERLLKANTQDTLARSDLGGNESHYSCQQTKKSVRKQSVHRV
jgi:hypothetical protein